MKAAFPLAKSEHCDSVCRCSNTGPSILCTWFVFHYSDVIMTTMASQITSLTIVYSTVYSVEDQRKHHSSASLAFVQGIHRWPVNSQHKGPVTQKMFPFDDIIVCCIWLLFDTGSVYHIPQVQSRYNTPFYSVWPRHGEWQALYIGIERSWSL